MQFDNDKEETLSLELSVILLVNQNQHMMQNLVIATPI